MDMITSLMQDELVGSAVVILLVMIIGYIGNKIGVSLYKAKEAKKKRPTLPYQELIDSGIIMIAHYEFEQPLKWIRPVDTMEELPSIGPKYSACWVGDPENQHPEIMVKGDINWLRLPHIINTLDYGPEQVHIDDA